MISDYAHLTCKAVVWNFSNPCNITNDSLYVAVPPLHMQKDLAVKCYFIVWASSHSSSHLLPIIVQPPRPTPDKSVTRERDFIAFYNFMHMSFLISDFLDDIVPGLTYSISVLSCPISASASLWLVYFCIAWWYFVEVLYDAKK